jgi:hypothetical protein
MGSLVLAYVGGWLAVAGYVGWLAAQNARLGRRADEIEASIQAHRDLSTRRSRAA